MQFYVPEIGDEITLTEDWVFQLHAENRNETMGLLHNHHLFAYGWIDSAVHPQLDKATCNVKYWEDYRVWSDAAKEITKPTLDITIEAGQKLKIDRIYIRKGISEYSSITFYAKGLGTVLSGGRWGGKKSNKAIRFWAKLADCNNIKFEK
jgi:hypothetical protein